MKTSGNKQRNLLILLAIILAALLAAGPSAMAGDQVADLLADRLSESLSRARVCTGCGPVAVSPELVQYYRERLFQPIWVDEAGLTKLGDALLEAIENADRHGLNPGDYYFSCLSTWPSHGAAVQSGSGLPRPADLAGLDIVLSDAFVTLATHLSQGTAYHRGAWAAADDAWRPNVYAVFKKLARTGDMDEAIRALAPTHEAYWKLVEAGDRMRRILKAGGWPEVPRMKSLEPGESSPAVEVLRKRMEISGDLPQSFRPDADPTLYDEAVVLAVKLFQFRHGLPPTGEVGRLTQAALNVSADKRLEQIHVTLERWRRLTRNLGQRYIMVNTASFQLEAVDHNRRALTMNVVVGKRSWPTPQFSADVKFLDLNPWWYVPISIMPEIKSTNGYEAFGEGRLAQRPGPRNALGRVKIVFPNRHNVYLHDTPSKYLFKRYYRAYSHGCIRMHRPRELALFLLRDDPEWTEERLNQEIRRGVTKRVMVEVPARVHIVYLTAWVGEENEIHFRDDLYGRDRALSAGLRSASLAARQSHVPNYFDSGRCPSLVAAPKSGLSTAQ